MMKTAFLLVLAVLPALVISAPVGQCPGGTYARDSSDCKLFYSCKDSKWIIHTCPALQHYDFIGRRCISSVSRICVSGESKACQNGGLRKQLGTKDVCECPNGYVGELCNSRGPACPSQCKNGGRCMSLVGKNSCVCQAGFIGDTCETDVDECASDKNKCQEICKNTFGSYACGCNAGRFLQADKLSCGTTAPPTSTQVTKTCSPACQNGGRCDSINGVYRCSCPSNYEGAACERQVVKPTDSCAPACINGGQCVKSTSGISQCFCANGFTGSYCQQATNTCPLKCLNGGICNSAKTACLCPSGFPGVLCEKADNPCTKGCQNGGACTPDKSGCVCPTGFTGAMCETAAKTTLQCASGQCKNGGSFIIDNGVVKCKCTEGFSGFCCEKSKSVLDCPNRQCQNGGKFKVAGANVVVCDCQDGYEGMCCETKKQVGCVASKCQNGGICFGGLPTCVCKAEFSGDFCEVGGDNGGDAQPQMCKNARLVCRNGGRCVDREGIAVCHCLQGYIGYLCEIPTNPTVEPLCATVSCQNNGTCSVRNNKPICDCRPGFGGVLCENVNSPCAFITCENNGHCNWDGKSARCVCKIGYTGDTCETESPCLKQNYTCENKGVCIDASGTPSCVCRDGFMGERCEKKNMCSLVTCLHGGKCEVDTKGLIQCKCEGLYTGSHCEKEVTCDDVECLNDGHCKIDKTEKKALCVCKTGLTGDKCQHRQKCEANNGPCKNGASCQNTYMGFQCTCPMPYYGPTCESKAMCKDNMFQCENGGSCNDTGVTKCDCSDSFMGPTCAILKDDCGGCLNGGKCNTPAITGVTTKSCACPVNYRGDKCELKEDDPLMCPASVGATDKSIYILFPDRASQKHVRVCQAATIQRVLACPDTAFNAATRKCFTADQYTALETALKGDAIQG